MAFAGMRGTGDWATSQRPKNWRETILYLYPNGTAPLTAMLSKMKSSDTDDPEFNWWTKNLAAQRGTITGAYTNSGLSSAYGGSGSAGDTLYIKMAAADEAQVRVGHQVLLRDASDLTVDVNARVTAVSSNGASSYIAVILLEDDDNSASHDIADADTFLIIGNMNEEGAVMPSAISYNPTKFYNYTQIFRTPLDITRTARKTRLRTGDAYKELKREALELHSIEMEKAFFFGVKSENTGSSKLIRSTDGILNFLRTNNASNVVDYTVDYSGSTWLTSGETWLDDMLEVYFRYGSTEKVGFCGSGAVLGIHKLVKNNANYQLIAKTVSYGIKVLEWVTPFGSLYLKLHPLFSYETTLRNTIAVIDMPNLEYRYIDDTFFKPDEGWKKGGYQAYDATKEEFLTECGLELHHPSGFGMLNNVGVDG